MGLMTEMTFLDWIFFSWCWIGVGMELAVKRASFNQFYGRIVAFLLLEKKLFEEGTELTYIMAKIPGLSFHKGRILLSESD